MGRLFIRSYLTVLFVVFFQSDVHCLQWTGPVKDGSKIPACVNRSIALPWDFTLDPEEKIQDISWQLQKPGEQPELIAVHRSGDFLPTEDFSQRVLFLANAGLVLNDVTMADSGQYSVEVDVHNASKTFAKHEMAFDLVVADFFQVTQDPEPTYDDTTDSWHVQLKCGLFSSLQQPAGVTWMTPSGASKDSTSYKDGYLYLQLSNPVEGGTYSCRLPPNSSSTPSTACLPDDAPLSMQQPTFTVDRVEARLNLLEAENRQRKEASRLPWVTFFARLAANKQYASGVPVIFDQVVTNHGDAYSPKTGEFTAPYNGIYFLAVTSLDVSSDNANTGNMEMKVNDSSLCSVLSLRNTYSYDMGSCNAIARLSTGQKVWMRSTNTGYYERYYTTFNGFLIIPD